MEIIRDLWTLSEISITILDSFENTKNALIFPILVGCGWLKNIVRLFIIEKWYHIAEWTFCVFAK